MCYYAQVICKQPLFTFTYDLSGVFNLMSTDLLTMYMSGKEDRVEVSRAGLAVPEPVRCASRCWTAVFLTLKVKNRRIKPKVHRKQAGGNRLELTCDAWWTKAGGRPAAWLSEKASHLLYRQMLHLSAGRSFLGRRLCPRNSNVQNASEFNAGTNVSQRSDKQTRHDEKHFASVLLIEPTNYRVKHESNVTTLTRFMNIQQHPPPAVWWALKK